MEDGNFFFLTCHWAFEMRMAVDPGVGGFCGINFNVALFWDGWIHIEFAHFIIIDFIIQKELSIVGLVSAFKVTALVVNFIYACARRSDFWFVDNSAFVATCSQYAWRVIHFDRCYDLYMSLNDSKFVIEPLYDSWIFLKAGWRKQYVKFSKHFLSQDWTTV